MNSLNRAKAYYQLSRIIEDCNKDDKDSRNNKLSLLLDYLNETVNVISVKDDNQSSYVDVIKKLTNNISAIKDEEGTVTLEFNDCTNDQYFQKFINDYYTAIINI